MKQATIHSVYAEDDILSDLGWYGVLLYVAIDHSTYPDGEALFASLSNTDVFDWCAANGYTPVETDDTFIFDRRWRFADGRDR